MGCTFPCLYLFSLFDVVPFARFILYSLPSSTRCLPGRESDLQVASCATNTETCRSLLALTGATTALFCILVTHGLKQPRLIYIE